MGRVWGIFMIGVLKRRIAKWRCRGFVVMDIIQQYINLQNSGMAPEMERVMTENALLKRVINDMSAIATAADSDELFTLVIEKTLERLVPKNLLLMLQYGENIHQQYFSELHQSSKVFDTALFFAMKGYFDSKKCENGVVYPIEGNQSVNAFKEIGASVAIPLVGIEGTFGIVIMSNKVTGEEYTSSEAFYIKQLLTIFSLSIQNRTNYNQAITDKKTGLYTFAYFQKCLAHSIKKICSDGCANALLMLDIDKFKTFNDKYSHLTGDAILIGLSKVLRQCVRNGDYIARFGGDEFLVLLCNCHSEFVSRIAERIRTKVEQLTINDLHVTVSIGCYVIKDPSISVKAAVDLADKALYQSKNGGRNCITIL